ncbi:MAG: MtaA/CmuA family methyltransferase [Armatimonadota bacterium]
MNARKRFLSALAGGRVDRPSVVCVNQTATLEQMTALNVHWPEAHTDPYLMARLAAGANTLLGFDAVRVPFCQTLEAEALGAPVHLGTRDTLPTSSGHPFRPGDPVPVPSDLLQRGRIPVLLGAIGVLRSEYADRAAVIAGVVGPFSVAGHLLGTDQLLMYSFLDPDSIRPAMEAAVRVASEIASAAVRAGADVVCVEDMAASTDLIRPQTFTDLVLPYLKELISAIPAPVVLHICGNTNPILDAMVDTGADALSIDCKASFSAALRAAEGRAVVIGPIDTTQVLLHSSPEEVAQSARALISDGAAVVAPACAVPPGTPTANLVAMVHAAEQAPAPTVRTARRVVAATASSGVFVRYDVRVQKGEASASSGIPDPLLAAVADAVIAGSAAAVREAVRSALRRHSPLDVVNKALVPAIDRVGELWDQEYFFLPQVILAADAMQAGIQLCEQEMGQSVEKRGKIVMHVAEGDVHSIGKNIVKALLVANGFEVIDLGVDVPVEAVVAAVKEHKPIMLTGSALMTTTMSAFPKIARMLEAEGIDIPFACGGGAVTQQFVETFNLGVYGGKAHRAPAIAKAAAEGKNWRQLREMFH